VLPIRSEAKVFVIGLLLMGLVAGAAAEVPQDPIHFYDFDEGSGTTLYDQEGSADFQGNDNILSNGWTQYDGETMYEWNSDTNGESTSFETTIPEVDLMDQDYTIVFRASQGESGANYNAIGVGDYEGSCGFNNFGFKHGSRWDLRNCAGDRFDGDAGSGADRSTLRIMTYKREGNTMYFYINGNQVGTQGISGSFTGYEGVSFGSWSSQYHSQPDGYNDYLAMYDYALTDSEIQEFGDDPTFNTAPSIDSVSTSPESWTLGSSINVSANASDPDNNLQGVSADVWENGTQIVSGQSLTNNSGTWEATDLFTVDESDVRYNLTVTATDSSGATDTYETSQLVKQLPPKVAHLAPQNNSEEFTYRPEYEIRIRDDGDNVPGENITCDLYDSGEYFRTVSALENESQEERTFSGNLSNDAGSQEFKSSCVDGFRSNTSTFYDISRFKILDLSTVGPVYETENVSYSLKVKAGSMVEDMESEFLYNGTERTTRSHSNSAGEVHTYEFTHYFRPPLVSSNQTDFSWSFNATGTYQAFNGSNISEQTKFRQGGNQTVLQAYHSPEISVPRDRLIEKEDFTADLSFTNELQFEEAEIDGYLSFNGTEKQSRSTSFDYPLVGEGGQSSTKTVSGRIDLSFRNKSLSRSSVSDDSLTGHKKIITDCSSGSASQTVFHRYQVFNEENRTEKLDADIDYNYDVTHHGEHERNYAFGRSGKSVETCIYPSWAEYRITGPVQYNAQDFTPRAYEFFNATINNETETTNLYLLPESVSTAVYYRVEKADGSGVAQATVKTMRYFVDQNSYLTISKVETDNNGEAQTYQKINDIYYKYMITKDGEVLKETQNQILTCSSTPCTKVFTVDPNTVSDYFKQKKAFSYNCRVNEDGPSLQCTVNHESGSMEKATLKVDEHQRIGEETICDIETVQTGSSMVCQLNNLSEYSYSYELKGYKDGDQYILTYGSIDKTEGIFGNDSNGLFMAMFLVLTAAGLGRYSPGAAVMWTCVGLSGVYLTGILTIPVTALTGIIAVGVIALLEVRS
jgi:hypothetical protein